MRIGDIIISESSPLVIPEIGINHGGDINVAKAMVRAAARAGAQIVKHQTHIVEDEMCQAAKKVVPGNSEKSKRRTRDDGVLRRLRNGFP